MEREAFPMRFLKAEECRDAFHVTLFIPPFPCRLLGLWHWRTVR